MPTLIDVNARLPGHQVLDHRQKAATILGGWDITDLCDSDPGFGETMFMIYAESPTDRLLVQFYRFDGEDILNNEVLTFRVQDLLTSVPDLERAIQLVRFRGLPEHLWDYVVRLAPKAAGESDA